MSSNDAYRHQASQQQVNNNNNDKSVTKTMGILQRLDDRYNLMTSKEEELEQLLQRLQREEKCLKDALCHAKEKGESLRDRKIVAKDAAAISRLEEVLMDDDDDDDSSSEGDDDDVGMSVSISIQEGLSVALSDGE